MEKSKESQAKDLKKSKEKQAEGLEKPQGQQAKDLEKSKGMEGKDLEKSKLLVIVDWHLTLVQNDGTVDGRDLHALELLTPKVDVMILSYVASSKRAHAVPKEVEQLVPFHKKLRVEVCWERAGGDGKCAIAWDEYAHAVFDDNRWIMEECAEWGLEFYPIQTKHQ